MIPTITVQVSGPKPRSGLPWVQWDLEAECYRFCKSPYKWVHTPIRNIN
jgi:hypothetical protein